MLGGRRFNLKSARYSVIMAEAWCGATGTDLWFNKALSPCWYETAAPAALAAILLANVALQSSRMRQAQDLLQQGRLSKGLTAQEGGFAFGAMLLSTMHLLHLGASLILLRTLYYHEMYHLAIACLWIAAALLSLRASRVHVPLDFRQHAVQVGPDGYVQLAGDLEAAADSKAERTWISLFWAACTYVWPEKKGLQVRTMACFLLLVAMRFLNLATPILYKKLVDTLAGASAEDGGSGGSRPTYWQLLSPWILLYLAAMFFQGGGGGGMTGFINNLRGYLWIPVSQDAYRRISLRVFNHVMGLDLNFHLARKTGEVTKQVERGTNAMQNILSTILFSIVPQMFDVLAASTYLAQALEPTIAIIVFITVGSYIPITIYITEWRGKLRREMNRTDQITSARLTDALLNYETVKYFNNEDHENQQYANAIDAYQKAEYKSSASINILNSTQSFIMFLGIAGGLLVCVQGVQQQALTVGDVVLFLSMMAQLYGPLNWFGTYYRTIQQYMIDMENLFELLERQPKVEDKPGAWALTVPHGHIEYDDVSFSYEPKAPVLNHVRFIVPGGGTIAFVGATGSGKSTLTRLLFRFYDVTGGAIRIDGQDIRDVTQMSLRKAISMVPQDTVLFNDTILHNIRYGNIHATDEQVFEAAQAACIHEAIMTRFPKGYETIVGERGLRLSGGEKQRVAFARAILKNPPILALDEATSALDSITEKKIQAALQQLRQQRTTLIVAHRLSTISDADIIVVLREGCVVETGTHEQLLQNPQGLYSELWAKQLHQGDNDSTSAMSSKAVSSSNLVAVASDQSHAHHLG